jgi:hypothetical protein
MREAAKRELMRVPVHDVFYSLIVSFSPSSHTHRFYCAITYPPLPYHQHYNDLRGFQALDTFDERLAGTDHKEVGTTYVAFLTDMRNKQPP